MKRSGLAGGSLVLVLALVVGCTSSTTVSPSTTVGTPASGSPAAQGSGTGSLVVAETVAPQTFDPTQSSVNQTWYSWQLVYQGLVEAETDGTIKPLLATEWTVSQDRKTYDFTLRDGVKFSDGSLLTPDDVVFSFTRLMSSGLPFAQARFPQLESVTNTGPKTVRFALKQPDCGFLLNLGSPFLVGSAILSKTWAATHNPKTEMMGTGPFQFVSYSPNRNLILARNPYYWDKASAAKVDKLTIQYMPTESAAIAALQAGRIDLMYPSAQGYLELQFDSTIQIATVTSTNTMRLNINTRKAPFDNELVRQAMSLALDRQAIVDGALLGQGVPSAQVPPSYSWAPEWDSLPNQKRDVAKAKELLAQAGYPNGFSFTLSHNTESTSFLLPFANLVMSQLAEVGIKVTIESNSFAVWLSKETNGSYEVQDNWYAFQADPFFYLWPRVGRQGPTPQAMSDLMTQASQGDPANYTATLVQVARMQAQMVFPDIAVAAPNAWVAYGKNVGSVNPDGTLSRDFLVNVTVH